ncbi:DUF1634 domain-containing protein [Mucilaginibacter ginkgonis]|uniref:DUF1634 domain-containing protein n=1 Tax=Mucilaginibacter ginkgonis TaxID=2682091 RepID=A0A6I4INJ1_9SPHI|nr:DUF1634 domain-containing protein [Mucilaginibacter ginkgonis]QQL48690.1 DUF1634 domain-containing protein [Mucilaginibacter ginkgonis]
MAAKHSFKDTDMQRIIGLVLRAGVILSISVVFIGGLVYLHRHGSEAVDYHKFIGVPEFVHSLSGIIHGIFNGRGRAVIQMGIILLIITPIVRIIFSAIGFVLEKDWLYVGITLAVLIIIIAGSLTGNVG